MFWGAQMSKFAAKKPMFLQKTMMKAYQSGRDPHVYFRVWVETTRSSFCIYDLIDQIDEKISQTLGDFFQFLSSSLSFSLAEKR